MREFGRYVLLERLKHGGMAEVHLGLVPAKDGHGRLVAVKVLRSESSDDGSVVSMFIDEAKLSVLLDHPNIVRTYEFGVTKGRYFIVMEFVPGPDLESVLERLHERARTFPQVMAAGIVADLCDGLDYAHGKRNAVGEPLHIVHRDVSPQNVLLSYTGKVKLIDFGIAKATSHVSETQVGALKGKYAYMSPEQVRSQPVDCRSDVFAAGNLLYELLTGQRLFTGSGDYEVLDNVRTATFIKPREILSSIDPVLEGVILRALELEPGNRFQSAAEMGQALRDFLKDRTQGEYGPSTLREFVRELFVEECAYMTGLAERALKSRFDESPKVREPSNPQPDLAPVLLSDDERTQPVTEPEKTRVGISALSRGRRGFMLVLAAALMGSAMVGTSLWFKQVREAAVRGGGLVVTTEPEGARLTLDDTEIGTSPFSVQGVRAGGHDLIVELEGYSAQKRVIEIYADEVTIIELELSPK